MHYINRAKTFGLHFILDDRGLEIGVSLFGFLVGFWMGVSRMRIDQYAYATGHEFIFGNWRHRNLKYVVYEP